MKCCLKKTLSVPARCQISISFYLIARWGGGGGSCRGLLVGVPLLPGRNVHIQPRVSLRRQVAWCVRLRLFTRSQAAEAAYAVLQLKGPRSCVSSFDVLWSAGTADKKINKCTLSRFSNSHLDPDAQSDQVAQPQHEYTIQNVSAWLCCFVIQRSPNHTNWERVSVIRCRYTHERTRKKLNELSEYSTKYKNGTLTYKLYYNDHTGSDIKVYYVTWYVDDEKGTTVDHYNTQWQRNMGYRKNFKLFTITDIVQRKGLIAQDCEWTVKSSYRGMIKIYFLLKIYP